LGQGKDYLRKTKEIYIWLLIPVYIMIAFIVILSFVPGLLLAPIGEMLKAGGLSEGALTWVGRAAYSDLGQYNPPVVMGVVIGVAAFIFLLLVFVNRRAQKVKQFNIFYAGEAPSRPELTHYAYNFFAHYQKAVGFLTRPLVTRFWNGASEGLHSIADYGKVFYTGNGQSYLFFIVGFVVAFYFITMGG
jgi:hypothetical protein